MALIVIYPLSNPEKKKKNIIINKLPTLFNNFKANLLPENKIKFLWSYSIVT